MQIMCKDKVVAEAIYDSSHRLIECFRAVDGVEANDLPFELFGLLVTKSEVTFEEFLDWVADRCVPEYQIGIENKLKRMGLTEYDPMAIARKTGLHAHWKDDFWIKFEEGE